MSRALLLCALALACTPSEAPATPSPRAAYRVLVADDASGGLARRAQLLAAAGVRIEVVPRAGDAGSAAVAELVRAHPGDAGTLAVVSDAVLAHELLRRPATRLAEAVPVARLGSEPLVLAIARASPIANAAALRQRLDADASAVRFAGAGVGSPAHQLAAQIVREATRGVSGLVYAAYASVEDASAAVAGGQSQVVIAPYGLLRQQFESGKLRPLALASPARIAALPDVATLREAKIDLVGLGWALLIAPAGITTRELSTLRDLARRAHADPAWAEAVQRNGWVDDFSIEALTTFVGTQLARAEGTLRDLELIR